MWKYILGVAGLLILLFLLYRNYLIRKICTMDFCEKIKKINDVAGNFGFAYEYAGDYITNREDAWQKSFGYNRIFDEKAPLLSMVLDSEPVYFDYKGKTWLLEIWKGQYGITAGAEVGLYCADGLVSPQERATAQFHAAPLEQYVRASWRLLKNGIPFLCHSRKSWWITGFRVGQFVWPHQLQMGIMLTFPNEEMLLAFTHSLLKLDYELLEFDSIHSMICFPFDFPRTPCGGCMPKWYEKWVQWKNRCWILAYQWITWPFEETLDRLNYLLLLVPFAARRVLGSKKQYRQGRREGKIR